MSQLVHVVQLIFEQIFCSSLIQSSCSASWCVLVRRGPLVGKTVRDRISQIEAAVKGPVYIAVPHCNKCSIDSAFAVTRKICRGRIAIKPSLFSYRLKVKMLVHIVFTNDADFGIVITTLLAAVDD